jgi:nitrate reductase gamma subunit
MVCTISPTGTILLLYRRNYAHDVLTTPLTNDVITLKDDVYSEYFEGIQIHF